MAIYLDYAAATPLDDEVLAKMKPYFSKNFANPSALYGPARESKLALEQARQDIAQVLGCKSVEIIFTAGGTEANNLSINGVMQAFPDANIVTSTIEHDSVKQTVQKYDFIEVNVTKDGLLDLDNFKKSINDKTVLVSIIYANNEIGTVQHLRRVSAIIADEKSRRVKSKNKLPIYLHTDAAQAGNYLDVSVHRLGVDMMSINGGKIYGPKQSGVLFVKSGTVLNPLISGGGQERGLRSGTENVAGNVGLAAALTKAFRLRNDETKRIHNLQQLFIKEVKANIPNIGINGSLKRRLPNNLHITIPNTDNERVLIELDNNQIFAAQGSACSASSDESSHVLKAIGLTDTQARSSLRFSLGRQTTEADIKQTVRALVKILAPKE